MSIRDRIAEAVEQGRYWRIDGPDGTWSAGESSGAEIADAILAACPEIETALKLLDITRADWHHRLGYGLGDRLPAAIDRLHASLDAS